MSPFDYNERDAYIGPLGDIVERLRGHVPVNALAVYCQLLVAVGTLIGRRAVARFIEDDHHPNLFLAMVGESGIGKGTTWRLVQRIATQIDRKFPGLVPSDAASTPGLIGLVRDPADVIVGGKPARDTGVADKRCLVVYEEMESLVTAIKRRGSTLGQVWRLAWDGRTLENNGRNRERATNPHISCICHVTPDAFRGAIRQLGPTASTSGFWNRFLVVPVFGERRIHRHARVPAIDDLVGRIQAVLATLPGLPGDDPLEMKWDPATNAEWDAFCDAIADRHSFLTGVEAITGRLKPMVMRVALIMAVVDGATAIKVDHLRAAKTLVLMLIDQARGYFGASEAVSPRERIEAAATGFTGAFCCADLRNILKRRRPGILAVDLHAVIDELLAEGRWQVVEKTEHSDHRGWRFAVQESPASTDLQPQHLDEMPPPPTSGPQIDASAAIQLELDSVVRANGPPFGLGKRFITPREIDALDEQDRPARVPKGAAVSLVQFSEDSTRDDKDRLAALQARKPHHRLVWTDGKLMLIPAKPCLEWAQGQADSLAG